MEEGKNKKIERKNSVESSCFEKQRQVQRLAILFLDEDWTSTGGLENLRRVVSEVPGKTRKSSPRDSVYSVQTSEIAGCFVYVRLVSIERAI